MTLSLSKLMAVADKATDGPWSVEGGDGELDFKPRFQTDAAVMVCAMDDCDVHPLADCSQNYTCREEDEAEANATHIATFDPPTVKRLLTHSALLIEVLPIIEDGIETEAELEAEHSVHARKLAARIRAALEGVEL